MPPAEAQQLGEWDRWYKSGHVTVGSVQQKLQLLKDETRLLDTMKTASASKSTCTCAEMLLWGLFDELQEFLSSQAHLSPKQMLKLMLNLVSVSVGTKAHGVLTEMKTIAEAAA